MIEILFTLSLVIVCALFAVTSKNIVYAVIALLATNVTLGIAYYMMGAPTVALFQLAIFAGAVVVFFVITVMLTKGGDMPLDEDEEPGFHMSKLAQLALALVSVAVLVGSWLTVDYGFPLNMYRSSAFDLLQASTASYDSVINAVTQLLWGFRSMDLISQSFVILAAIICCIAMLKTERRKA